MLGGITREDGELATNVGMDLSETEDGSNDSSADIPAQIFEEDIEESEGEGEGEGGRMGLDLDYEDPDTYGEPLGGPDEGEGDRDGGGEPRINRVSSYVD